VVAVAGDYAASGVSNDSAQPGATVAAALDGLGAAQGALSTALSALAATVPGWPDASKAIVQGGPLAPSGGSLVNTGLFLTPPPGVWCVYQITAALLARFQGPDTSGSSASQGRIAFGPGLGTPDARMVDAGLQDYSPAVPIIQASVLTITAAGELLIGVGNGDAVNPATFALLTMASGPVTLP